MEKLPVIIIGTGKEAKIVADYLLDVDCVIYGFLSLDDSEIYSEIYHIPVMGIYSDKTYQSLLKKEKIHYFVAVEDSKKRVEITNLMFEITKKHPISVIHSSAIISKYSSLAGGIVVGPGSVISNNVSIEADTIIGANVSIGSDTKIERGVIVNDGVKIGKQCNISTNVYLGLGSIINHHVSLGESTIVAPGAVVVSSIAAKSTVFGNPAQSSVS